MFLDTTLRRARLARGLTIDDMAAQTRLSPRLVILIDEGRFHELPGGLYARAYVRAFSSAIGLDPEEVLARVERFLPGTPDPLTALRGSLGPHDPETSPVVADLQQVWTSVASRARATLSRSTKTTPLAVLALRSAAACTDTLLLAALNGAILYSVAAFTNLSIEALIDANGEAVATFCGVTSVLYYIVLAGIGGQTLGARLFTGPQAAAGGPLRPSTILRRAGRTWFEQASILVDVVLYADPAPVKSLLSKLDVTRRRAA